MTQAAAEGTLEGVILPHKNAIKKKVYLLGIEPTAPVIATTVS